LKKFLTELTFLLSSMSNPSDYEDNGFEDDFDDESDDSNTDD
jgi:hypothetical protein